MVSRHVRAALLEAETSVEDANGEGSSSKDEKSDAPDPDAIDKEGDGGDDPSGAVNNDLSGKTVQSLSIEAQSKILPGAKEVVLSFNETTDSLRILVTPTGQVKFSWRGQLHDLP